MGHVSEETGRQIKQKQRGEENYGLIFPSQKHIALVSLFKDVYRSVPLCPHLLLVFLCCHPSLFYSYYISKTSKISQPHYAKVHICMYIN